MTEKKKEELRQLLTEAMENIEIILRFPPITSLLQHETMSLEESEEYRKRNSMSIEEYRESIQAYRRAYRPDLTATMLNYYPEICDNVIKSKLLNCIKAELAEYIRAHKPVRIPGYAETIQTAADSMSHGRQPIGYPIEYLLKKILEIAIAGGVEKAILALDKCTKETTGVFQKIIFLKGVGVGNFFEYREQLEEVQVSSGIRLVSLPTYPAELPPYLFEDVVSIMQYGTVPINFYGKTLMVIDYEVSPLFFKPPADSNDGSDPFQISIKDAEFPNFDVTKFCQALSLSCNFAVEAALTWQYADEDEIFNLRTGSYTGGADRIPIDVPGDGRRISETQIPEIKHLYNSLVNLNSSVEGKLKIPIERWIKSKADKELIDKIIDLGIAFESLYLSEGTREQLTLQFRLRASWHLGKDKEHRKKLMDKFKEIYNLRSQAVHSGKIPKKVRIRKGEELTTTSEFIAKAQDLCRGSIMKILEDGEFPDWNDLILGEESL